MKLKKYHPQGYMWFGKNKITAESIIVTIVDDIDKMRLNTDEVKAWFDVEYIKDKRK